VRQEAATYRATGLQAIETDNQVLVVSKVVAKVQDKDMVVA
jgi:hypothetical protein